VPSSYDALRALPGVGDYTAAAIATFGFGGRHAVLDTNVRRVLARLVTGVELPPVATTAAERRLAEGLLPEDEAEAATWSIALMELGALVCTAARPRCAACPVADRCAWRAAGYPAHQGPPRKGQTWAGTDRQVRGRLMAVVREAEGVVAKARLDRAWDDAAQRERCLESLLTDGLLVRTSGGYALPG
jgi:A/G-specific adenine glycosylase